MKILLSLSDDQAAVERNFTVNKEIIVPAVKKARMTSFHQTHDKMSTVHTKSVYVCMSKLVP